MEVDILLIFDWRDGPLEGVLRNKHDNSCWHFKMIAERQQSDTVDDRLYGLSAIPAGDCSIIIDEFGDPDTGAQVWPVEGGIGSAAARQVVAGLLSAERAVATVIVRTSDFVQIDGVWNIVD